MFEVADHAEDQNKQQSQFQIKNKKLYQEANRKYKQNNKNNRSNKAQNKNNNNNQNRK